MKHVNCEQKGGCRCGFQGTVWNYEKSLVLGHEMWFPKKQNRTFLLEKKKSNADNLICPALFCD